MTHTHTGDTGIYVYEHNGEDWYPVWQYGLIPDFESARMVADGNMAAHSDRRQRAFDVCQANIHNGDRSFYRCDLALDPPHYGETE